MLKYQYARRETTALINDTDFSTIFITELVDTTELTARAVAEFFAKLYHVSLSRWLCCDPSDNKPHIETNELSVTHTGIFATQKNADKPENIFENNGNKC